MGTTQLSRDASPVVSASGILSAAGIRWRPPSLL